MAEYNVMNKEQQELATRAAALIEATFMVADEKGEKLPPMAVFEALCTVAASYCIRLGLDWESTTPRIRDRYTMMKEFMEAPDQSVSAYIANLRAKVNKDVN